MDFHINPLVRLLDFIAGILICRLSLIKNKTKDQSLNEISSVILLLFGMYIFIAYQFPEILRARLLYLPLMVFIFYSFSSGNGVISKSLKNNTFVLMGEASSSLYMIHEPIINIAYLLYLKIALTVPLIIFSILLTVFYIASSLVTYKTIEQPIHKYLKKQIRDIN